MEDGGSYINGELYNLYFKSNRPNLLQKDEIMRNETDESLHACEDDKRITAVSAKTEGKRLI